MEGTTLKITITDLIKKKWQQTFRHIAAVILLTWEVLQGTCKKNPSPMLTLIFFISVLVVNIWGIATKQPAPLLIILISLLVLSLLVAGRSGWIWFRAGDSPAAHSKALHNLALAMVGGIGIPLTAWQVMAMVTITQEDSRSGKRYQDGAEMLGSEFEVSRIAGIYLLNRLALDYPGRYLGQVINLLSTFIRNRSSALLLAEGEAGKKVNGNTGMDIQEALTAIVSRDNEGLESWEDKLEYEIDLHETYLEGANLAGANLADANLAGTNLVAVNLTNANLTGADLTGNANLTGAKLTGANLRAAYLVFADLTGVDLTNANLADAHLTYAHLTDANLENANLKGADLVFANLADVNLADANLENANLADTDLAYSDMTNAKLINANLASANLTNANLENAKLTGADMTDADLTNANLENAKLTGAKLRAASLVFADMANADMTGTKLTNANLANAKLTGAKLKGTDMSYADLTDADMTNADMTNADMTGADLTGALGLNQEQLNTIVVQPGGDLPKLAGVLDSKTGKQLVWNGKFVSEDDAN